MSTSAHEATDPRVFAWVSANAGAGKTRLLTDRVTRLLLSGANASRILCLTYTKAAAAEMATRLFDRLGEWALLPDQDLRGRLIEIGAGYPRKLTDLREARKLFAQALETQGGLKIQTIHSFCQHLLARFPVEAGIPARFSVLDERSAGELMRSARDDVLEHAATSDSRIASAVALIAARASDGRFADMLDSAIADCGKLRELLLRHEGDEERFFAHLRNTLKVAEDEGALLQRFCAELNREREHCERVAQWLRRGSSNDKKLGDGLAAFIAGDMSDGYFQHLRAVFFTVQDEPRISLVTKATASAEPELLRYLDTLKQRVLAVEERRKCAVTASLTEALVRIALAVLDKYERRKRDRAALDYDDLIVATERLLEGGDAAAWVLYKLDGGLDHILVDEAQDTSPDQWKIVGKLAEEFFAGMGTRGESQPRTLFAVGDEKQSIFSFQGADPAGFGHYRTAFKARAEGAGLPFVDFRPAVSRRSAQTVLEFVDAVFASEAACEGLSSSNDPVHHDPHRSDQGRVEIWPAIKSPETEESNLWDPVDAVPRSSAQVVLASRIAARIAQWLRDGTALPGTGAPITAGDIMILVRRRNAFAEEMIRQLLDRGVAVAGADRMVLMDQIAIADLVALGQFALLPEDDLNLASLLKSPLVGFSEHDLYALAQIRGDRSLWNELGDRRDESPIFQHAYGFLADILGQADFQPPFEFYGRALAKGLRQRLTARLGGEAEDAIDEFLTLALAHENSHPPSLQDFLHWFTGGASDVKRDMEQSGGSVRVMTVHGAKGLEGNIVFLPDTTQVPDHARRDCLLYTEDCVFFGVPKALEPPPVAAAKAAARQREMREYRRLLYVAATRAREFLIVCGYETKKGIDAESWYPHLAAAGRRIGREETIAGESVIVCGGALSCAAGASASGPPVHVSPPEFFARPAVPEPVSRVLRPSDAAGSGEPAVISPIAESNRFRRGLFVHALLARLPEIASKDRERIALSYLKRQGVRGEDAKMLVAETLKVLADPVFAPLFAENSRAEVGIAAHLPEFGNARISGQIDRLAVTDESVLVADFKTNRPPPATVAETPRLYCAQMALYRAALQKIYPDKHVHCALVWTDGALLMPLPGALLDAEIARIAADMTAISCDKRAP